MNWLIYSLLGLMMLVCLIANPAPQAIEPIDFVFISIPLLLSIFSFAMAYQHKVFVSPLTLSVTVLYLCYLSLTVVMGITEGVALGAVIRSIAPYLVFVPLVFICLLPNHLFKPDYLARILIAIGLLQALYQLHLYQQISAQNLTTFDVLRSRITLQDPRTTLPLILAASILPFSFFRAKHLVNNIILTLIVLTSFLAGAATLTRSMILSMFVGWSCLSLLIIYYQVKQRQFVFKKFIFWCVIVLSLLILFFILLSTLPKFSLLWDGVLARFDSPTSGADDYSNGRLQDEWLPALTTWANASPLNLMFGIGAGHPFLVAFGEERTYIHNLMLYSLVYGGFFGFIVCLSTYLVLFFSLIQYALKTHKLFYLAYATLTLCLFFYGQLFAVHKGFAYNAMFLLLIALSLRPPQGFKPS